MGELKAAFKCLGLGGTADEFFKHLDKNDDQKISLQEWKEGINILVSWWSCLVSCGLVVIGLSSKDQWSRNKTSFVEVLTGLQDNCYR